jgi:phosphatidylglycerol---prolipoprotein diacylglyceryl transferase
MNLFVTWPFAPEIGTVCGITLRWYGICFALGLFLAGWYLYVRLKRMGYTQSQFESLLIYLFVGIFAGARLVHCLCYEPNYYLAHPLEIILPVTILSDGSWQFSGYHGFASHGGAAGVALALWLFCRRNKANFWPLSDLLAIATMLAGSLIRVGNLFNSEIVGAPTDVPWAFVFPLYDGIPRHPAQIYEAAFYLALFAATAAWYAHRRLPDGFFLGLIMLLVGIFRFAIEFLKEVQEPFERGMTLDMGQWLSLPLIALGVLVLILRRNKSVNQ